MELERMGREMWQECGEEDVRRRRAMAAAEAEAE